jgi:hypothetical protein
MEVAIRFQPDLIVTSSDGTELLLVVTVGRDEADRPYVEDSLKQYMLATNCPVGLLVVPNRLWIYRNRYRSAPEQSIEMIGPFVHYSWPKDSLPRSFADTSPQAVRASLDPFVQEVRRWLGSFHTPGALNALNADLRSAVGEHLLPVLTEGQIRAGVPRPAG